MQHEPRMRDSGFQSPGVWDVFFLQQKLYSHQIFKLLQGRDHTYFQYASSRPARCPDAVGPKKRTHSRVSVIVPVVACWVEAWAKFTVPATGALAAPSC